MFERFFRAYIEAALWSSTDDNGEPLDKNHGPEDIAPETLAEMRKECEAFYTANAEHTPAADVERAGHDFWLARNGHGVGFWDGDWPEPAATIMDEASKLAGERDLYVGDDGRIYQC